MPTKEQQDALTELVQQNQEWDAYDQTSGAPAKFEVGDKVRHTKGGVYLILKCPDERKLEYCQEAFYEYRSQDDNSIWVRRHSEMEDGRFSKI
jgi:hypothetical protein